MYIHREVKRSYAIWVDNATLNNHKTNKKNPVSYVRNSLLSSWSFEFKKPSKQYMLLPLLMIASQRLKVGSYW